MVQSGIASKWRLGEPTNAGRPALLFFKSRLTHSYAGVMYGLLTLIMNFIMDFITDFYLVKVSYKVCNKVGNKSQ